jgi:Rps23 Pro-64 3,4-dihydroxylase Tpa1-like proline 4-hydroxylase
MEIQTHQNYAVIDDVLSPADFAEMFHRFESDSFHTVNLSEDKYWQLSDGRVHRGTKNRWPQNQDGDYAPLYKKIFELLPQINSIIGNFDQDWHEFTVTPYIYPAGSSLYWHQDLGVSGSFTYYLHPEWNIDWGGNLLLIDEISPINTELASCGGTKNWLNSRSLSDELIKNKIGTYIFPRPNRLVFMKPALYHCISRVDSNAGSHNRCSLSGFVFNTQNQV